MLRDDPGPDPICEAWREVVMDGWLILLRIVHVGSAMSWFGGAIIESQRQRLKRAGRRMQLASRIDLPLLLLAGLTMAVARYL